MGCLVVYKIQLGGTKVNLIVDILHHKAKKRGYGVSKS